MISGKKKKKMKMSKKKLKIKEQAWLFFSLYIRLKATKSGYLECYTCGKILPIKEMQAGHAISGRTNYILFDEDIVRPQCKQCNIYGNGRYDVFIPAIIQEQATKCNSYEVAVGWFNNKVRNRKIALKLNYEVIAEEYKQKVINLLTKADKLTVKAVQEILDYYSGAEATLNGE